MRIILLVAAMGAGCGHGSAAGLGEVAGQLIVLGAEMVAQGVAAAAAEEDAQVEHEVAAAPRTMTLHAHAVAEARCDDGRIFHVMRVRSRAGDAFFYDLQDGRRMWCASESCPREAAARCAR